MARIFEVVGPASFKHGGGRGRRSTKRFRRMTTTGGTTVTGTGSASKARFTTTGTRSH
jgi:hypothetical protein